MEPYLSYMAAHMAQHITSLPHHPTPCTWLYKPLPSTPKPMLSLPPTERLPLPSLGRISWSPLEVLGVPKWWRCCSIPAIPWKLERRANRPPLKDTTSSFHSASRRRSRRRSSLFLAWRIWGFAGRKEVFKRRGIPDLGVQSKGRRRVLQLLWLEEDLEF